MGSDREQRYGNATDTSSASRTDRSPGKRTLTDGMAPREELGDGMAATEAERAATGAAAGGDGVDPNIDNLTGGGDWTITRSDGRGQSIEPLNVGDRILVHLALPTEYAPVPASGHALGAGGVLTPISSRKVPFGYEMEFAAIGIGPCNMVVSVELHHAQRMPKFSMPLHLNVEMDRQEFINRCSMALALVTNTYHHMARVLLQLTAAYQQAWTKHIEVLSHQSEFERIASGLILGAAMGFLPGVMKAGFSTPHFKALDFAADGTAGTLLANRFSVLQTLGVSAQKTFAHIAFSAMLHVSKTPKAGAHTDPDAFESAWQGRLHGEMERVSGQLRSWMQRAGQPGFHLNFDPDEVMQIMLTVGGQPLNEAALPDVERTAVGFEMGLWHSWLETFGAKLISTGTHKGTWQSTPAMANTEENILAAPHVYGRAGVAAGDVTTHIVDRCKQLGFTNNVIEALVAKAHARISKQAERINDQIDGVFQGFGREPPPSR